MFLQEDSQFTHVIAIDFGTGASGYGIAPKLTLESSQLQKPRIEVFNPVDDNDDQKTSTAILFDSNYKFLAFGAKALQLYAELIDDGDTGLLFQTVSNILIIAFNIILLYYSIKWLYFICKLMLKVLMEEKCL